jgi:hypothetical protein
MFFVRIDDATTRNVTGYECGNRAVYDDRHGGDPLWVFVDSDVVRSGIKIDDFLKNYLNYTVNGKGILKRKSRQ